MRNSIAFSEGWGGKAHVLQLAALATTDVTENRSRLLAVFH